ncbi:MAG: glutamate racemase [Candidatus Krumholzibacteriia bacterium]
MAPGADRPIGVFDSGLGGLTVLRALHRRLPAEDIVYFGDTARVPYGTKGARTVRTFAWQDAGFLMSHGIKLLVVACNTASAFALEFLAARLPIPVLGVIAPGVDAALAQTRGGPVGVIGTRGTINSGRYQQGLSARLPAERIVALPCPLFVPLVEEGLLDHPLTHRACAEYLTTLREARVDTLILGCTHYPMLKPAIARFMGPEVVLVDSAEALATAAVACLESAGLRRLQERPGELAYYLSDLPWTFREEGERYLGRPIDRVVTVNLDELEGEGHLTPCPEG